MDDDVYQSIQRTWTIDSGSTEATSAYGRNESFHGQIHEGTLPRLLDTTTIKHDNMQCSGVGLRRQSSALTQIVSNRTVDDVKNSSGNTLQNDLSQCISLLSELDQNQSTSFVASCDDEKTTYSNATVTTVTASFVANTPNTSSLGYTSFCDAYSDGEALLDGTFAPSLPLHLRDDEFVYYRIVYRGVVPLLSAPDETSQRSGKYLSYGEVFACRQESESTSHGILNLSAKPRRPSLDSNAGDILFIQQPPVNPLKAETPLSSLLPSAQKNNSRIMLSPKDTGKQPDLKIAAIGNNILRVDKILTGGYAIDAPAGCYEVDLDAETPKRSNAVDFSPSTPVDLQQIDGIGDSDTFSPSGYLFATKNNVVVAERMTTQPIVEVVSSTIYKVMSSVPIPILMGPSFDAPKTKALLLPGTVQDVSLRICFDPEGSGVFFLRLSHRRGWVADRQGRSSGRGSKMHYVPVMIDISQNNNSADDVSISGFSSVSTTMSFATATSRRRHRPPRRIRNDGGAGETSFPRQIASKPAHPISKYNVGDVITSERLATPSSNVSILSEDSSFDHCSSIRQVAPASPDRSCKTNQSGFSKQSSVTAAESFFFLMRVTAPSGLKILDGPQFQVNSLIRRGHPSGTNVSSSHSVSLLESKIGPPKNHHSIFQTMSSRLTTTGPSKTGNPAVFDASSKTRILPRGALFEASRRMEKTGAFSQGAGLVKLSDNSGWAIVPRQDELDRQYRNYNGGMAGVKEGEATRAYVEVGNAVIAPCSTESGRSDCANSRWIRVSTRAGIQVTCAPPVGLSRDGGCSPSSSRGSSTCDSNTGSNCGPVASSDSDIASSVGSSFLDAMFRTPKKKEIERSQDHSSLPRTNLERIDITAIPKIPCGSFVEVERWSTSSDLSITQEYARLRGGQGWIPLFLDGKITAATTTMPEIRYGSIWFRVQSLRGIKVRLGPSKRAPSIKSEEGDHFRFECGEFLRASEVLTVFADDGRAVESFAKLYRNRHVQLRAENVGYVHLSSLTSRAEWVQVYCENELFLEECAEEPRIERHKQGWRYNVVPDDGIEVRKGPSFASEKTGIILFGGESILITERVSLPGDKITWLRMKDGHGWVYDVDQVGETMMIAHSLRYRTYLNGKQRKPEPPRVGNEIAYNAIIARLFHNDEMEGSNTKNMSNS